MKKHSKKLYNFGSLLKIGMLLCIVAGSLLVSGTPASANYFEDFYNGVEKFSDLPGQVNQLKDSYQETLDELERTKENAKAFREQNAQLVEQNRQLAETVNQLKEVNEAKDAKAQKFKIMLITVIVLIAGYFIGIRLLRFMMRRSNRKTRI